jgi:hypothetical protein
MPMENWRCLSLATDIRIPRNDSSRHFVCVYMWIVGHRIRASSNNAIIKLRNKSVSSHFCYPLEESTYNFAAAEDGSKREMVEKR